MPRTYYTDPTLTSVPHGDGSHLWALVDFFCPATEVDRMLICAMIVTLFWGGRAGARPAFLVTALVRDQQQGRGVGKTSVVELIASLAGGLMMFSGHDKKADVDNRLLSSGGTGYRLLLLDNLKTHRLSIADLEAQITAPVISGIDSSWGKGSARTP